MKKRKPFPADKHHDEMLEDIDLVFGQWTHEKLRLAITRAKYYLRKNSGRPQEARTSDDYHDAIHRAARNVRRIVKATPKEKRGKGWTIIGLIRSEIDASADLKQGDSTERAIRKAMRAPPIKRLRLQ